MMTPTQQRRQREKENLRRAILDAARELFISEGYDNVSMRKIAEKIKYSPTTIYLHFQDKSEILVALCDEGFLLMAACLERLNSIEDPVKRLREGRLRYIQFARQQPQYYVIMFEMQDNALEMDMAKKTESAGYRCFSFMMRCILEGIDQGIIIPSVHPLVMTHSVWAGVHGAASLTLSGRLGLLPEELHQALYNNKPVLLAEGVKVRPARGGDPVTISGQIEPVAVASVAAEVAARVVSRPVQRGDAIPKGGILVVLDDASARASLDQAIAAEAQASASLRQLQQDYSRIAIETQAAQEQAKAQLNQAQAGEKKARSATRDQELRQAESMLKQAQTDENLADIDMSFVRLFFARILETRVEVGEMTSPTSPTLKIGDIHQVKAVFAVPEASRPLLQEGNTILIAADFIRGKTFAGKIRTIGYEADNRSRTFPIEITISNPAEILLPGMVVRLALTEDIGKDMVVAPLTSVASDEAGSYVITLQKRR